MNTTVYIGAPEPSELQSLPGEGETRVIVVEPLPGVADRLRNEYAGSRIEIIEAVVSAGGGNQLYEYGMQDLSSLHKPNRLAKLYPGLKTRAVHPVSTLAPSELPERLKLSRENENSLHLNAPGEERSITQQLVETKAINHFKRLSITLYDPDMYADDQAEIDPKILLKKAGFNIKVTRGKSSLYERLDCTFDVNRARVRTLESKLKQLNEQLDNSNAQSAEAQKESESARERLAAEQEANKQLRSKVEASQRELDHQKSSNNELKAKLEKVQGEVKERRETVERLEGELAPLRQQINAMEKEGSEIKEKLLAEQKALASAQSIIEELKGRLKSQAVENEQQLDAEFIKAESQLELIKDILIREKLF